MNCFISYLNHEFEQRLRLQKLRNWEHHRMAKGGHGLPQVSPRPAMPYLSTPRRQATPETALWLFQG